MVSDRNPGGWQGMHVLEKKDSTAYSKISAMNDELCEIKKRLRSICREETMLLILRESCGAFDMDRKYRIDKRRDLLRAIEPDLRQRGDELTRELETKILYAMEYGFSEYLSRTDEGPRAWQSFSQWIREMRREERYHAQHDSAGLHDLSRSL